MDNVEILKSDKVLKEILKDSCGGIIYNNANLNKYDTTELLEKWDKLTPNEKVGVRGIIEGAINFIKEK